MYRIRQSEIIGCQFCFQELKKKGKEKEKKKSNLELFKEELKR